MEQAGTPSFEAFVRAQRPELVRLARVLSADRVVAEDIVADVLSRAMSSWDRIGGLESPAAYVRRMVVNEHLTWRRRVRTMTGTLRQLAAQTSVDDVAADRPDDVLLARERRDQLIASLRRLPPRQRMTLALRYYAGLTDAEIADLLGTNPSTVRSNAARGLAALRITEGIESLDPNEERPVR